MFKIMDAIKGMPYQSLYLLFLVAITGVSIMLIPHHNTIGMLSYTIDLDCY